MSRRLRARGDWNRAGRPLVEFDGRRIWQHVVIDGPRRPWESARLDAAASREYVIRDWTGHVVRRWKVPWR